MKCVGRTDELVIDILEDVYPREIDLDSLSKITGYGKTYLIKTLVKMKKKGWVRFRKTPHRVFVNLTSEKVAGEGS